MSRGSNPRRQDQLPKSVDPIERRTRLKQAFERATQHRTVNNSPVLDGNFSSVSRGSRLWALPGSVAWFVMVQRVVGDMTEILWLQRDGSISSKMDMARFPTEVVAMTSFDMSEEANFLTPSYHATAIRLADYVTTRGSQRD